MAELKAGTTIGGSVVWTQGNFPLTPVGNTLTYKTFKVYSEHDKPQAADNDFVSKASGGKYSGLVEFGSGITITGNGNGNGIFAGPGDGASRDRVNLDIKSHYGIGIYSQQNNTRSVWINARNGEINTIGPIRAPKAFSTSAPTEPTELTNKNYVDSRFNSANNNANTKVSKSGDTMTGNLNVPAIILGSAAALPTHAARLDQVVTVGSIIDFGEY